MGFLGLRTEEKRKVKGGEGEKNTDNKTARMVATGVGWGELGGVGGWEEEKKDDPKKQPPDTAAIGTGYSSWQLVGGNGEMTAKQLAWS